MSRLPVISRRDFCKVIESLGWTQVNSKRSHRVYRNANAPRPLGVPDQKELQRGTMCALIRRAGLSIDEFLEAYDKL